MSTNILTPQIHYRTGPILPPIGREGSPRSAVLDICSEYMPFPTQVASIQASDRVEIIQQSTREPIILALTPAPQSRLVAYIHVPGGPTIWQSVPISPPTGASGRVTAFDVDQTTLTKVIIAAAVKQADGTSDLFVAEWQLPQLSWNDADSSIVGDTAVAWTLKENNLGRLSINTVTLSHSKDGFGRMSHHLVVGTDKTAEKTAMHYQVDLSPEGSFEPFSGFTFAGTADRVLDISAGTAYPIGAGVFALWQTAGTFTNSTDGDLQCKFNTLDGKHHYDIQIRQLGRVKRVFAHPNIYGTSDLFAASEKGVAYYNYHALGKAPTILVPDVSFKNVSSAEQRASPTQSKLVVFALSDHDELYYIEGTRDTKTGAATLTASEVPIRRNVDQISAQYNAANNLSELVYLGNGRDEVFHLWRNPADLTWMEQMIKVKSTGHVKNIPSFITTIVMKDESGAALQDIPLSVTADMAFVNINGRSHILDSRGTDISLDKTGKVTIIQAADSELTPAHYTLSLPTKDDDTTPFQCEIMPSQRVISRLASIKSMEDLKNATNSRGQKVFAGTTKSDTDFKLASQVGSKIGDLLHTVSTSDIAKEAMKKILGASPDDSPVVEMAWEKTLEGLVRQTDVDWLVSAVDTVSHYIGDVLEYLRAELKSLVKVAFKIVGPMVQFFVKIGMKVMRFVLSSVGPIIRSVITFFGDLLGMDVSGLLDWLGLLFDNGNTLKTQKKLLGLADNAMTTVQRFCKVNKSALKDFTLEIETLLAKVIKDTRSPKLDEHSSSGKLGDNPLSWILDNPIMQALYRYMPLNIILEALNEEAGEFPVKIPDMSDLEGIFSDVLSNLAGDELEVAKRELKSILNALKAWMSGEKSMDGILQDILQSVFWTAFDATKLVFFALLDVLTALVDQLITLLRGRWDIPFVTELWEEFTGCPFTVIDVTTFVFAQVMNILTLTMHGRLPFDLYPVPENFLLFQEEDLSVATALAKVRALSSDNWSPADGTLNGTRTVMTDADLYYEEFRNFDMLLGMMNRCSSFASTMFDVLMTSADAVVGDLPVSPSDVSGVLEYLGEGGLKMVEDSSALQSAINLPETSVQVIGALFDGVQLLSSVTSLAWLCVYTSKHNILNAGRIGGRKDHGVRLLGTKMATTAWRIACPLIRWKQPLEIPSAVCTGMGLIATALETSIVDIGIDYENQSEQEQGTERSKSCFLASSCVVASTFPAGAALILAHYVDDAPEEIGFAIAGCELMDSTLTMGALGALSNAMSSGHS